MKTEKLLQQIDKTKARIFRLRDSIRTAHGKLRDAEFSLTRLNHILETAAINQNKKTP